MVKRLLVNWIVKIVLDIEFWLKFIFVIKMFLNNVYGIKNWDIIICFNVLYRKGYFLLYD